MVIGRILDPERLRIAGQLNELLLGPLQAQVGIDRQSIEVALERGIQDLGRFGHCRVRLAVGSS